MIFFHNEYLKCELPDKWCAEENADNLLLYHPNGSGAITLSFLNVLNTESCLDEQVSILAKRFIDRNNIKLNSSFILLNKEGKTILYGSGTTLDSWFIKLWVVAKYPKIIFATYESEKKDKEIKICDTIIDSIQFIF